MFCYVEVLWFGVVDKSGADLRQLDASPVQPFGVLVFGRCIIVRTPESVRVATGTPDFFPRANNEISMLARPQCLHGE
jgi:hypothetical protein